MERETRPGDVCGEEEDEALAREHDLVVEHLPRVRAIVQRLVHSLPPLVDREELVQGGVLGLIDAARRFKPELGCSFAAYSEIRIRGAVLPQLRALDWMPRALRERGRAVDRVYHVVEQREGRAAESEEVADLLGLTPDRFEALRWLLRGAPLRRIDEHFDDTTAASAAGQASPGQDGATDPLGALGTERTRQTIADAIAELPRAERTIVSLAYWEELGPDAIADVLGLAQSRVRALHVRALLRLRRRLRALWE